MVAVSLTQDEVRNILWIIDQAMEKMPKGSPQKRSADRVARKLRAKKFVADRFGK